MNSSKETQRIEEVKRLKCLKKWLEDTLRDSQNLVVKTYKSDQWDRYLVDVFYLPKATDMIKVAAQGT